MPIVMAPQNFRSLEEWLLMEIDLCLGHVPDGSAESMIELIEANLEKIEENQLVKVILKK